MHPTSRDSGFTLIEVVTTLALMGVVMAFAVSGWSSWARASAHSGTAHELRSVLRQAQQRAVTEGRAMCVQFAAGGTSYTVFRGLCDDPAKVRVQGPLTTRASYVLATSPSFLSPTGTASTGVSFTARGTAWPGTVKVTREGAPKVYLVKVEGLTGRVSIS